MSSPSPTTDTQTRDRSWLRDWPVRLAELGSLGLAYVGLVAFGLAVGFLITDAPIADGIRDFDVEAAQAISDERTSELDAVTLVGSELAGTVEIVVGLVVVGSALLAFLRRWKETATLWTSLSLEALTFLTVSSIVGRDRPPVEQLDASPPTASFPSGHTGASAAFYLTLATFVWWATKSLGLRVAATFAGIGVVFVVAVSRLYRGMHFVTDVTVGALMGAVCVWVAARVVTRGIDRREGTT